ncbi:MAG: potassium channel family protein [Dethiobacter sp.]|jgi:voltage-gated potassium channel|nr:potassium channel family protein [Dethiobacter sp.]
MKLATTVLSNQKKLYYIYELIMAFLALAVLAVLIIEFTRPLNEAQQLLLAKIDFSILAVFAVDYFYRLARTKEKWKFFKSNIFDLIAIMPFDKAFRLARLARLTRLTRLSRTTRLSRATRITRVGRIIVIGRKFVYNLKGILTTNGLHYMLLFTACLIITGAISIKAFEPNMDTFGDALWWALVTATTVGYGDISPESAGGRIVAAILMLGGIGFLGMVTGSIATYFVDKLSHGEQKKSVASEQIEYVKNKLNELEKLEKEDLQHITRIITSVWEETKINNAK